MALAILREDPREPRAQRGTGAMSERDENAGAAAAAADERTPVEGGGPAGDAAGEGSAAFSDAMVKTVLRRVKDPELNLNVVDLGLIYDVRVSGSDVSVDMSLTSPGCPSGPEIMTDVERQLQTIPGVGAVAVNLVWSPIWTPDRIEPRVRAYLGF